MAVAFPEKSTRQIEQLVRDTWGNIGSVIAEYPHLKRIQMEAAQRLEIVIHGNPSVFASPGKGAVFVSAHLANWEIAPVAVIDQGVALTGVFTPMSNPWLNRIICRARNSIGFPTTERDGAVRKLLRQMRAGYSIGLLVDQRVDSGEPLPFFGHDMRTTTTPAQFALRFNCELIPVQVQRLRGARFRVVFHNPVTADDADAGEHEKVLQMTRKLNELFEAWIRERPHEWMCSKRRWAKNLRP